MLCFNFRSDSSSEFTVFADNCCMQVSSITSTGGLGSKAGGDIAALQKQLRQLTDQLKNVASLDMEPKAKEERVKLIQIQIQMVQQQIVAIQRQSQQEQLSKQLAAQAAKQVKSSDASSARTPGLGGSVDVYV
nr:FlxA-like family protein [uncultured Albidiferax sp.]